MSLKDRRALEGLPLKLLITVMVMALSAQPLYGALSYLSYAQGLDAALGEAQEIRRAALSAFAGGPGNIRRVSIDLGKEGSDFSISLGGQGTSSNMIEVLYRGEPAATLALEGRGCCILTPEGRSLLLDRDQELSLSCIASPMGDYVLAEAV